LLLPTVLMTLYAGNSLAWTTLSRCKQNISFRLEDYLRYFPCFIKLLNYSNICLYVYFFLLLGFRSMDAWIVSNKPSILRRPPKLSHIFLWGLFVAIHFTVVGSFHSVISPLKSTKTSNVSQRRGNVLSSTFHVCFREVFNVGFLTVVYVYFGDAVQWRGLC
jgi:hypothetical protein